MVERGSHSSLVETSVHVAEIGLFVDSFWYTAPSACVSCVKNFALAP